MRNTPEEWKKTCDELIERNVKLIKENKELRSAESEAWIHYKSISEENKRLEFIIEQGQKLCTTHEDTIEEQNDTIKGLQEELQISYKCHEDECDNHEATKVEMDKLKDKLEMIKGLVKKDPHSRALVIIAEIRQILYIPQIPNKHDKSINVGGKE